MIPIYYMHFYSKPALGCITDDHKIVFGDMSNSVVEVLINSDDLAWDPGIMIPGGDWSRAYIKEWSIVPKSSLFPRDQMKELQGALRETTKLLEHVSSWNCESSADYAEGLVERNAELLHDSELAKIKISHGDD